jgi:hypothetical protein
VRCDRGQRRQPARGAVRVSAFDRAGEDAVTKAIRVPTISGRGPEEVIGGCNWQSSGPAVHQVCEELVAQIERDFDLANAGLCLGVGDFEAAPRVATIARRPRPLRLVGASASISPAA